MIQEQKHFVDTRNVHKIETLLHCAGGHQGSRKAHQAGSQKLVTKLKSEYGETPMWLLREDEYYIDVLIV